MCRIRIAPTTSIRNPRKLLEPIFSSPILIVTGVFSDTVFVQEQPGGPYSGISVFLGANYSGNFAVRDVVNVEGYYHEYFGNTS